MKKYIVDPKEVYSEELDKLLRCFSNVKTIGESVSEIQRVNWRHVEHLRHLNFILQEAVMTGESLMKIQS